MRYKNVLSDKKSAGFWIYNIFDEEDKFNQAYNRNHPPLPAQSREYLLKNDYKM